MKAGIGKGLFMASVEGPLEEKLNEAIMKLQPKSDEDESVPKRLTALKNMLPKVRSLEKLVQKDKDGVLDDSEAKKMKTAGKGIVTMLNKYAEDFNVTDISGILGLYPAPEVGLYGALEKDKSKTKLFDGTTREAHHAPAFQLADSLATALNDAAAEIDGKFSHEASEAEVKKAMPWISDDQVVEVKKNIDLGLLGASWATPIREIQSRFTKAGKNDLSAILVHSTTHREKAGGKRIHGSEIRKDLTTYLRTKGIDPKQSLLTSLGEVSVRGSAPGWSNFIKKKAAEVSGKEESKVNESLAEKTPKVLGKIDKEALELEIGKVSIALKASKVDGKKGDKNNAVKELKKFANTTWKPIIGG